MGYILLSIEHLVFWTLAGAILGVGIGKWRSASRYRWLPGFVVSWGLLPLLFLVAIAWSVYSDWLKTDGFGGTSRPLPFESSTVFAGAIVWTLSLILAVGALLYFARQRSTEQGEQRISASWLALALLGVALLHAMTFWNLDLTVRQQIEAMRVEAGAVAVSLSPPVVVDSENAAVVYQEVFESGLFEKEPPEYAEWFKLYSESPGKLPVETPQFIGYVSGRTALVNRIREATMIPNCNFRRDWGRPSFAMLLPETQNLRSCARELILSAHLHASKGDVRAALRDIAAVHRVADHVGQEPIVISQLVSFASEHYAVTSLEHILRNHPVTKEDLDELGNWPFHSLAARCQSALRMEEAFGLASASQVLVHTQPDVTPPMDLPFPPPEPLISFYRVFFLRSDLARYQQNMELMQNAVITKYEHRVATAERIDQSLKTQNQGILNGLLLPAFGQLNIAIGRADARQRLARLAIALHGHRLEHGSFPESLEAIRQTRLIPLDPFDDQPLRMTRRDGRLVIYSIGVNRIDDQGQPETPDPRKNGGGTIVGQGDGDIVFWLEK
ncbi:MAG: hypothetical protein U1A77_13025 [Pirellulales bacterium]